MSAAEPARTGSEHAGPAKVIAFRRRPRHREAHMPIHPPSDLTPAQRLAATLERTFADHGRSLTDHETAEDFTITLTVFRTLLKGALEQGKLAQGEFDMLDGMIEGMLTAPRLLA